MITSFLEVKILENPRLVENCEVFEKIVFSKKLERIYLNGTYRSKAFCLKSAHQKFVVLFVARFQGEYLSVVKDFGEVVGL